MQPQGFAQRAEILAEKTDRGRDRARKSRTFLHDGMAQSSIESLSTCNVLNSPFFIFIFLHFTSSCFSTARSLKQTKDKKLGVIAIN